MDCLPPELVAFVAFLGVLDSKDIFELAFSSKRSFQALYGSEWALSNAQALKGFDWCCEFGLEQSVRKCLEEFTENSPLNHWLLEIIVDKNPKVFPLVLKWCLDKTHFLGNLRGEKCCTEQCIRFEPRMNKSKCLKIAARKELEILELLLEDGRADPRADYSFSLESAASWSEKAVRLLLEDGRVDPENHGHLALLKATDCNQQGLIALLEDNRVDPNHFDDVILHALRNNPESVRIFLAWCRDLEHFRQNLASGESVCDDNCIRLGKLSRMEYYKNMLLYSPKPFNLGNCWYSELYRETRDHLIRYLADDRFDPTFFPGILQFAAEWNLPGLEVLLKDPRVVFSDQEEVMVKAIDGLPGAVEMIMLWCRDPEHFDHNLKDQEGTLCDESCERFHYERYANNVVKKAARTCIDSLKIFLADERTRSVDFFSWSKKEIASCFEGSKRLIREYLSTFDDREWGKVNLLEIIC